MRSALIARDSTSETLRTADSSLWVQKRSHSFFDLLISYFLHKSPFLIPGSLDLGQAILEIFINKAAEKCPTLLLTFQEVVNGTKKAEGIHGQRHPSIEVVTALLSKEIFQIQNGEIHKIKSSE